MSETTAPPAGAMAFSVTVADTEEPAATVADDNVTAFTADAVVVVEEPPPVPDAPLGVVEPEVVPPLVVAPLFAGEAENEPESGLPQPVNISSAVIVNAMTE